MKVLHIINNLGSGGAEKLLEEFVPLMNESNDVKADILLLTDENNVFTDSLVEKGVKVDVVKYRNIYDLRNTLAIRDHIINGDYDIVHSHLFPTQYWVALSKLVLRSKDIKFITTEHSTHNRRREKRYFRHLDKFIYAQYDTIISITDKTRENLLDWIDPKQRNTDKHIVIKNGVNLEKIREALPYQKKDLVDGIHEDIKFVCMVGRFSEAKDQGTVIKAISKLPDDVHLILLGEGALMDENKRLAQKLTISSRVHFLGFRQDIPRILKTVDIVVLSSNWEGFGLAAVEGMASGKPVIVSDVEGLSEVVKGAGLLFTKGDSNELMRHIKLLLNDEYEYLKIQEGCIKRAGFYSIDRMVQVYKSLLESNFKNDFIDNKLEE